MALLFAAGATMISPSLYGQEPQRTGGEAGAPQLNTEAPATPVDDRKRAETSEAQLIVEQERKNDAKRGEKQAQDDVASLKAGTLMARGVTGGVAFTAMAPLPFNAGGAKQRTWDVVAMPYFMAFPALIGKPQSLREYCASAWVLGNESEATAAATAIARKNARHTFDAIDTSLSSIATAKDFDASCLRDEPNLQAQRLVVLNRFDTIKDDNYEFEARADELALLRCKPTPSTPEPAVGTVEAESEDKACVRKRRALGRRLQILKAYDRYRYCKATSPGKPPAVTSCGQNDRPTCGVDEAEQIKAKIIDLLAYEVWNPSHRGKCWSTLWGLWVGKPASFTTGTSIGDGAGSRADREIRPTVAFGLAYAPHAYFSVLLGATVGKVKQTDSAGGGERDRSIWSSNLAVAANLDLIGGLFK